MKILLRRLIASLLTLWVIVTITFILIKAVPGDPFTDDDVVPEEIMNALRHHYGLDLPWHFQYVRYLKSVISWDLGPSYKYKGRMVNEIISEGFPVSAMLGIEALCIAIPIGLLFGTLAALRHHQWPDRAATILSIIGISVPSFILASILQYLLAIKLPWFPVARWGTLAHSILPALSLSALPMAFIARLTRSSMLEVLHQDYIKTALSKGLGKWRMLFKHALRNALLPVFSYLGQLMAHVLVGSFVVERIFSIPGLGQWFVVSVVNRDYTAIMGVTVFYSIILLITVCLVDLLYCVWDPRISHSGFSTSTTQPREA